MQKKEITFKFNPRLSPGDLVAKRDASHYKIGIVLLVKEKVAEWEGGPYVRVQWLIWEDPPEYMPPGFSKNNPIRIYNYYPTALVKIQ